MSETPPIIVSSLDLERLEALLDSLGPRSGPEIAALRGELERAEIVDPDDMPPTVVTMNSTVRFQVENSDDTFEMTLCYPRESGGEPHKLSILAPMGSALLGLSVGQTIDWPLPGKRTVRVRILEVTYQPERAGDLGR